MAAAIIQGAAVIGLTIFLVLGQISILKPEVAWIPILAAAAMSKSTITTVVHNALRLNRFKPQLIRNA
jgi:cation transport ATPase